MPMLMVMAEARCSQFPVSTTGATTDSNLQAFGPKVAYNPDKSEALIVWFADKIDTAFEVYGQIVSTKTGKSLYGNDFQISKMGTVETDTRYDAMTPSVAYSTKEREYLVVFQGDQEGQDNAFEIYGQRVSETGELLGTRSFQISQTGADPTDSKYLAANPHVVYNSRDNVYYVVWEADAEGNSHAVEIWGAVVSVVGDVSPIQRLSFMGIVDTDTAFNGFYPDVAYNSVDNEYLVVWQGENATHHAFEAYGQIVEGATGLRIGKNFQISDMGIDPTSTSFRAFRPKIEYNPTGNNYLVVWYGDTDRVGANGVLNIYGQIVTAGGGLQVPPSFPISQMGESAFDPTYDGVHPDLTYNANQDEYFVVWEGDEPGQDDANEVYAQRLTGAQGAKAGSRSRLSVTGANDADSSYVVQKATVTYASGERKFVAAWGADSQGAKEAYEINVALVGEDGVGIVGDFCSDAAPASTSRNTTAAAILVVVALLVIFGIGFVVYKIRANRQKAEAERAAAAAAAAREANRGGAAAAKSAHKGPGTHKSRKVKVSRKKKSRKPPTASRVTKGLNAEPSYSYVSYETYTYEFDDEISSDSRGGSKLARVDGAVDSGSGFYSDEARV
ncbi:uncharacterized protein AMSG_09336 [Thecamonas trahens ATCC 50062]|uniref:Uncharacterized protein n=1 Tax=Thecamonas trahens ATCC 50062 TaxID=461836 RepID=A0A0L0DNP5_THETB|nr:hypothetical protein AMSG_09336 [Thecamonas trahens ATCC 50062]KNC53043.1 hypothetical protein AMSG_09336 [Thecamonas trahens ATCC 50062]|eukprot:XP_013754721.1 hypothetical protein AMSG_09336 [Thecamonas trahens ATCC 50062]